jgi:NAD+ diphosphatase
MTAKDVSMPSFVRTYPPASPDPGLTVWLPFHKRELLTRSVEGIPVLLDSGEGIAGLAPTEPLYLGTLDGRACLTWDVGDDMTLPEGIQPLGLRAALAVLPESEAMLAGYASQMLDWRRTSRFCPVCGHETEAKPGDWGRHCPNCGYDRYPHVSPAVLILVHDGDKVLLSHKPGWGDMHSILAGFVEPGESLEDCVHREVLEEVGLDVTDLVYGGSQPWPFPHQLMVGFTARYAGGEIAIQEDELDGADWFTRGTLPSLPSSISLSRRLLDTWIRAGSQG